MSLKQRFKAVVALGVVGAGVYAAVERRDDIKSWLQEMEMDYRIAHTVNAITNG